MKKNIHIKPLKKFLSEDISPKQLAELLDELAYDYARINLDSEQSKRKRNSFIHSEADNFIYYLKTLRDILRKCKS